MCIISKPSVNSNWSYSPETRNSCQNWRFLSHVTLNFDVWPWKTIWRLFYTTSTFVRYCKDNGEFKLEILSWNAHRVKIGDFLSCVTSNFDGWRWNKIGHLFYDTLSFVLRFKDIGELKLQLQSGNAQFGSKSAIFFPCDIEIRRKTLKNNRAPFLCYFKLCALKVELQSENAQLGSKSTTLLAVWHGS